jgi:hypothetical protein
MDIIAGLSARYLPLKGEVGAPAPDGGVLNATEKEGLILRSIAQQCVSKDGPPSSFETRSFAALLRMRAENCCEANEIITRRAF